MRVLSTDSRVAVLRQLVEGSSLRSTVRITGVAMNTILKLLKDVGDACAAYQREHLRGLNCPRFECDEIWCYCYMKDKNVPDRLRGVFGYGDVWTWVALCAQTKLVPCWLVGRRDTEHAIRFMRDLGSRLDDRIQLTTDGFHPYREAVAWGFPGEIDYAMLVKIYGKEVAEAGRYSPPICIGSKKKIIRGNPDPDYISTSYAERSNLSIRMGSRRFTRLTNAFSKKIENLEAAVALYFMHYNFARRHTTLRISPAMAAGVTHRLWSMRDIVDLID